MKLYTLFLLGLILAISSCEEDDPGPTPQIRGEVNLTVPLSRQKTLYQRFTNSCPGGNFDTDADTIVLEVILEDGIKFFDEYGTSGSMNSDVRNHQTRMRVEAEVGVLRIFDRPNSYLFASLQADEILVDSTYSEVLWRDDCAVLTTTDSTVFEGTQPGLMTLFALDTIQLFGQKLMAAGPHEPGIKNKYVMYDARHLYMSYDEVIDPNAAPRMIGWIRIEP